MEQLKEAFPKGRRGLLAFGASPYSAMALFKKKGQKGINLVPESEKSVSSNRSALTAGLVSGGLVLLVLGVSLIFVFLNVSKALEANKLEEGLGEKLSTWQQLAPIAQQSVDLKVKATQIKDLKNSNKNFKESLERIRKYIPNGVKIESLTLKSSNSIQLQATSAKVAELYQLASELDKQEKYFESAEISSLVKTEDGYVLSLNLKSKSQ